MAMHPNSSSMTLPQQIYTRCCDAQQSKPNVQILRQLDVGAASLITRIDASCTFLGSAGIKALLDFVSIHQGIRSLNLTKNGVDADCIQKLCGILENHQSLSHVDVSENVLSTPSVRALWEVAQRCNNVQKIEFRRCNVAEEWEKRLERCFETNQAFHTFGFRSDPIPRRVDEWSTAFVGVVGPAPLVAVVTDHVMQVMNSLSASVRVRVAPIVLLDTDTPDALAWKIDLCRDRRNYDLPRLIAVVDRHNFRSTTVEFAVSYVLSIARPEVPPLKNKLGQQREPIRKCASNCFVYFADVEAQLQQEVDPARFADRELSAVELQLVQEYNEMKRRLASNANSVTFSFDSAEVLSMRAQTDIYCSFLTTFGADGQFSVEANKESQATVQGQENSFLQRQMEMCRSLRAFGEDHPADIHHVLQYIDTPPASNAYPLVLYGGEGIGKAHVAAAALLRLLERNDPNHIAVPLIGGHATTTSPVNLCYALLGIFRPSSMSRHYATLQSLAEECKKAIESYSPSSRRVSIFILSLDRAENLGRRDFNLLSFLPTSLPVNVRLVVTVATESPLLVQFRNLVPQPYERLVQRAPSQARIQIVCRSFSQKKLAPLPGLEDEATTENAISVALASGLPSVTKLILGKEDVSSHVYCELVGLILRYERNSLTTQEEVMRFVEHQIPQTVPAVLAVLIESYGRRHGVHAIRSALLTLAASPVPMTELVVICEQIAGCPRHTVLPVLLELLEDGIVTLYSDAIVNLSNQSIVSAVKEYFGNDSLEEYITMVGSHLFRLITTYSPEMSFAFRRCVPLLLHSMQHDLVESIVLNPTTMGILLKQDNRSRVWAVDAIFRLLHLSETMRELLVIHDLQFRRNEKRRELTLALVMVQTHWSDNQHFFQRCLVADPCSPFRKGAFATPSPPYPALKPWNDAGQEFNSVYSEALDGPGTHCSIFNDTLVVSTNSSVNVYNLTSLTQMFSLSEPFGPSVAVIGALLVSESRVVVVAKDQLILWDLSLNSWVLVAEVTCSLSSDSFDVTRTMLVGVNPTSMQILLVDLNKKKVVKYLPYEGVVREVQFASGASNTIVVASLYEVTLLKEDNSVVVLQHHGVVRCLVSSPDGKFFATAVENTMYIWTSRGELLHLCAGHNAVINDVNFHPNGSMILSCGEDGTVKVWKTLTGLILQNLSVEMTDKEHHIPISANYAQFSPDGTRILVRCAEYLRMWDAITFFSAGAVPSAAGFVNYISLGASHVAAVTQGGRLVVWSTRNSFPSITQAQSKSLSTCLSLEGTVSSSAIKRVKTSPDGEFVMIRDGQNHVSIWRTSNGSLVSRMENVQAFCALDEQTLFTIEQHRIVVVSFVNRQVLGSYPLPRDTPLDASYDISFTKDAGQLVVTASAGTSTRIYMFDLPSLKLSNVFVGHVDTVVHCRKLSDDLFLSASEDGTVRLWSLSAHAERTQYHHPRRIVSALDVDRQALGEITEENPLLFVDDDGDVFDVLLSFASVASQAKLSVRRKLISTSSSSSPSPLANTSTIGATPLKPISVNNSQSEDAVVPREERRGAKLTSASRLDKSLIVIADENGALFIVDELHSAVLNALESARCSAPPEIRGGRVFIGTFDGEVKIFTLQLP